MSDGALLQEGFVDDPDCDYTHPSLAADGAGNIGLGCTRTSANEFPSVYIMMRGRPEGSSAWQALVLARTLF